MEEGGADEARLDVEVDYDRTKLSTADLLQAKATLKYNGTGADLNGDTRPGHSARLHVDPGDFAEMVAKKKVQKFSVTSRQVMLYLGDVKPGDVLNFEYGLKPRYPLRARTPASWRTSTTPRPTGGTRPVELVVEEKK